MPTCQRGRWSLDKSAARGGPTSPHSPSPGRCRESRGDGSRMTGPATRGSVFVPWQRKTTTTAGSMIRPFAFPSGGMVRLGTHLVPGRLRVHLVQPVRQVLQLVGEQVAVAVRAWWWLRSSGWDEHTEAVYGPSKGLTPQERITRAGATGLLSSGEGGPPGPA